MEVVGGSSPSICSSDYLADYHSCLLVEQTQLQATARRLEHPSLRIACAHCRASIPRDQ